MFSSEARKQITDQHSRIYHRGRRRIRLRSFSGEISNLSQQQQQQQQQSTTSSCLHNSNRQATLSLLLLAKNLPEASSSIVTSGYGSPLLSKSSKELSSLVLSSSFDTSITSSSITTNNNNNNNNNRNRKSTRTLPQTHDHVKRQTMDATKTLTPPTQHLDRPTIVLSAGLLLALAIGVASGFIHQVAAQSSPMQSMAGGASSTTTTCGYPGSPAHASVTFSSPQIVSGTAATYTCDNGYELLGPPRRICQSNGTWSPIGIPFCVLNVGLGKAAMQSSTAGQGSAQKAVDGSTSQFFQGSTCTMTDAEHSPWWYVNLLEPYLVQIVRIDFGTACCANKQKATIAVRVGNNRPDLGVNTLCNRYTGFIEEGKPLFLPCTRPAPGAFVSIHLESPNGVPLSICETFIYTDHALSIEQCPSFRDQPLGSTATYNGKCYLFHNNQALNFDNARRYCEIRGGTLVDETSPALQGFLSWELYRRHRADQLSGQYWLGAVRDPRNGQNWKWINGKDVQISFWNSPATQANCSRFDGSKGWLWSDTDCNLNLNFICQYRPLSCGKPEKPTNSTLITRNVEIGTVIEYKCAPGNMLLGPNLRTCLSSGFFSEFAPKCKYLDCGYPAMIANGDYKLVNGSTSYQSVVNYSCNLGYILYGRSTLSCDVDERWNGPPPDCKPMLCPVPVPPSNGYVTVTSNVTIAGTKASFDCRLGYELMGQRLLTCNVDGFWDSEFPFCKEKRLPITTTSTTTSTTASPTASSSTTTRTPSHSGIMLFPSVAGGGAPSGGHSASSDSSTSEHPSSSSFSIANANTNTNTNSNRLPNTRVAQANPHSLHPIHSDLSRIQHHQSSINGLPASIIQQQQAINNDQQHQQQRKPSQSTSVTSFALPPPPPGPSVSTLGSLNTASTLGDSNPQTATSKSSTSTIQQPTSSGSVNLGVPGSSNNGGFGSTTQRNRPSTTGTTLPTTPTSSPIASMSPATLASPNQNKLMSTFGSTTSGSNNIASQIHLSTSPTPPNIIKSHTNSQHNSHHDANINMLSSNQLGSGLDNSIMHNNNNNNLIGQQQHQQNINNRLNMASARFSLDGIIAVAIFGGFIFLGAIITIIVIIIKRRKSSRSSIDAQTISTFDSSGEHNGLYRNYQQAWENLRFGTSGNNPNLGGGKLGGAMSSGQVTTGGSNSTGHHFTTPSTLLHHHHNHHLDGHLHHNGTESLLHHQHSSNSSNGSGSALSQTSGSDRHHHHHGAHRHGAAIQGAPVGKYSYTGGTNVGGYGHHGVNEGFRDSNELTLNADVAALYSRSGDDRNVQVIAPASKRIYSTNSIGRSVGLMSNNHNQSSSSTPSSTTQSSRASPPSDQSLDHVPYTSQWSPTARNNNSSSLRGRSNRYN